MRTAAGVLALPWLESLTGSVAASPALGFRPSSHGAPSLESDSPQAVTAPRRFAFIYTPNGYNQQSILPGEHGLLGELPATLEPLAGVRERISLISGLDRQFVPGTGVHAQCGSCWLTSSPPQECLDGGFPTNITLDQLIAKQVGRETPLPSLELSCNDFTNNKETKYFESISWYGPGHAAQTDKNPRAVFQRLFGQPTGDALHRSVLDTLEGEAERLAKRLARTDREKLDEYLESVRATERRIQLAERAAAKQAKPPLPEPAGIPERRDDYLRLMVDLTVFAFQLDLTRVATLLVDPERWDSPRMFDGVFDKPENHHVLTHTKGEEAKAKITQIDRFHMAQYAYFIERLQSIREGERTLLDDCLVAMGSGISDGDKHDYGDLQVLLAGGSFPVRGYVSYPGKRPLADLWLTVSDYAGLELPRFADSTGRIKEFEIG